MRPSLVRTVLVVLFALCVSSFSACATASADDVSFFYAELAPYGAWVDIEPYGLCWVPGDVGFCWRPYTDGYWDWTDSGWCWESEHEWGWACFHYGRWFRSPDWGWCWVPGIVWAPCWCMWRFGDDWIGWCPLPPDENFRHGRDFDFDDIDFDDFHRWRDFCFCKKESFCDHDLGKKIVLAARNVNLLPVTKNVTDLKEERGRGVNQSFAADPIEKAIGHAIPKLKLADMAQRGRAEVRGDALRMFRPQIAGGKPTQVPPAVEHKGAAPSEKELLQREQTGRQGLEESLSKQRQELHRYHNEQLTAPPPGMSLPELHRQQQAEIRAFNEHAYNEREQFERRQEHAWGGPGAMGPPAMPERQGGGVAPGGGGGRRR